MRRWAIIFVFVGLTVLLCLVWFLKPLYIESGEELIELEDGAQVFVEGEVLKVKMSKGISIISLARNISVTCEYCAENFNGKNIAVLGVVESWRGEKEVRALRVKVLESE